MMNFLKNIFGGGDTATQDDNTPGPKNKHLSGAQFKEALLAAASNGVLLDVRTAGEVAGGKLPNALNIDIMSPSFGQKISQLDKNKTYFIYCRSGNRSGQACAIMHRMGFDVRNLNGGIGAFPK
jgi:rhodanese-related sulfurtransferase